MLHYWSRKKNNTNHPRNHQSICLCAVHINGFYCTLLTVGRGRPSGKEDGEEDEEEEDGMHRYQRKLPFVGIIENFGGSASRSQDPPRRRRDWSARLRGSRGRVRATTVAKRGGVEVRAHQLRILIMGAPPSLLPPPLPPPVRLTVSVVIGVVGSVNDYSSVDVVVVVVARHYSFKPSSNRIGFGDGNGLMVADGCSQWRVDLFRSHWTQQRRSRRLPRVA